MAPPPIPGAAIKNDPQSGGKNRAMALAWSSHRPLEDGQGRSSLPEGDSLNNSLYEIPANLSSAQSI